MSTQYTFQEMDEPVSVISRTGTSSPPITIAPDTVGGATISGAGQFSFTGTAAHVTVRGFRLTGTGTLRIRQVGIERLRFVGPPSTAPIDQQQFRLLTM